VSVVVVAGGTADVGVVVAIFGRYCRTERLLVALGTRTDFRVARGRRQRGRGCGGRGGCGGGRSGGGGGGQGCTRGTTLVAMIWH